MRDMDQRVSLILDRLDKLFIRTLGDDLAGVYVHGSLAFGCFTWETGDIDLIIVAEREPDPGRKREIIRGIMEIEKDAPEKGIEMSILLREDCRRFVHPMPYVLHYSKGHTAQYLADMDGHIGNLRGTDRDLAAHLTVMRAVGYPRVGPPVKEMFSDVPKRDYFDSLWYDIENAPEEICVQPVYTALNLLRVAAFAKEHIVLSKEEGGRWGMEHLPGEFAPVAERALVCYRTGCETEGVFDRDILERYAQYLLEMIRHAMAEKEREREV